MNKYFVYHGMYYGCSHAMDVCWVCCTCDQRKLPDTGCLSMAEFPICIHVPTRRNKQSTRVDDNSFVAGPLGVIFICNSREVIFKTHA